MGGAKGDIVAEQGLARRQLSRGRQLAPAGKLGLRTSICQDLICGRVALAGAGSCGQVARYDGRVSRAWLGCGVSAR